MEPIAAPENGWTPALFVRYGLSTSERFVLLTMRHVGVRVSRVRLREYTGLTAVGVDRTLRRLIALGLAEDQPDGRVALAARVMSDALT